MNTLQQAMKRTKEEFRDLKQADDDFEGKDEEEKEIKANVEKIALSFKEFEAERDGLVKFQTGTLENFQPKDFLDLSLCITVMIHLKEHKFKIIDFMNRLKQMEVIMVDLNTQLLQQDLENA